MIPCSLEYRQDGQEQEKGKTALPVTGPNGVIVEAQFDTARFRRGSSTRESGQTSCPCCRQRGQEAAATPRSRSFCHLHSPRCSARCLGRSRFDTLLFTKPGLPAMPRQFGPPLTRFADKYILNLTLVAHLEVVSTIRLFLWPSSPSCEGMNRCRWTVRRTGYEFAAWLFPSLCCVQGVRRVRRRHRVNP